MRVIVHHYWIAKFGFELEPWLCNESLQDALALFIPCPQRFIQKHQTRCSQARIKATGERFTISNMGKVLSENLAKSAGDNAFARALSATGRQFDLEGLAAPIEL